MNLKAYNYDGDKVSEGFATPAINIKAENLLQAEQMVNKLKTLGLRPKGLVFTGTFSPLRFRNANTPF